MASPGPKPKPAHIHVLQGTHRADRHGEQPNPGDLPTSEDVDLDPPKKLRKREQELWDEYIRHTPWLTKFDIPTAYMWVKLQYEFEKSSDMVASRIAQLRSLRSDLGLNHLTAAANKKSPKGKDDEYFD